MKAGRFLLGAALGGAAAMVVTAFGLPPIWAFLIALGVAAVIWLRLYRLDSFLKGFADGAGDFLG